MARLAHSLDLGVDYTLDCGIDRSMETNYTLIAIYTAEDGLDDLEQLKFAELVDAIDAFEVYTANGEFRDVQLYNGQTRIR